MKRIIEVCAGSYQDCLAAYRGGAQRAELNSALSVGGLTPSVAALRRAKQETSLKIICMVRPRAAGFCYDEADVQIMMDDARILLQEGADGIAFGDLPFDLQRPVEKRSRQRNIGRVGQVLGCHVRTDPLLWQRGGIPPRL